MAAIGDKPWLIWLNSAKTVVCPLLLNAQVVCSRAESSRCRAVFPSCVVSNRHPLAPPALPGFTATMGGSDFRMPLPVSSLLTLVHGCPLHANRRSDLLGYRVLALSGSIRPRTPGSTHAPRHVAAWVVACRRDNPVGTLRLNISGLYTFRVGFTRYLCTSPAFLPTHQPAHYWTCSKAGYWARG